MYFQYQKLKKIVVFLNKRLKKLKQKSVEEIGEIYKKCHDSGLRYPNGKEKVSL